LKLDDGDLEFAQFEGTTRVVIGRGTYTTSGSTLTMITTHLHGGYFEFPESEWYTRAQVIELEPELTDDGFAELFDITTTYSISGNTLTVSIFNEEEETFTKK
jgi:galactose mutarotase-like enzyme